MYNGMVDGWTRLPIRGIIWYQGCTNIGTMRYYPLLKTLIADWRAKWNEPELPFMIAQLAGRGYPGQKDWKNSNPNKPYGNALTRDIQQQMMKLPNVGVACTIDIGKLVGAHPANKQDVGKRLALEAERIVYGKNIVSRGPLFESATPENNAIRVTFKYAESGLKTSDGKAPGAFAVAGADKKFVWAQAKIDGKTVLVSSPAVKAPKYVRYAYAGFRGDCNLQNAEGLPAYPFRSDRVDYSNAK
jgi:sialate O-acetylesterase